MSTPPVLLDAIAHPTVPQIDPYGQAAKIVQLRNLMGQNQLLPYQLQQQQEAAEQERIKTSMMQLQQQSQQAMMNVISKGGLDQFFGRGEAGSPGFDAAGAYRYLLGNKVTPDVAQPLVGNLQTIDKNTSEIYKNNQAGQLDFLKNRNQAHTDLANAIADIMKLPQEQQAAALELTKQQFASNPALDPGDQQALQHSDPSHLDFMSHALRLDSLIQQHYAELAKAGGEAAKGQQEVLLAGKPSADQLTNALSTVNTLTAIPENMRAAFGNELKAAPDLETMQKVQARADAANESFQRSADARQQALALKDVGMQEIVAGKLVGQDQELSKNLAQTGMIRSLLDMSKGGNEQATAAALQMFAEHIVHEGGINRFNELEQRGLVGSMGSWGRQFQSWLAKGGQGQMPTATVGEIGTILDAEDKLARTSHDENVGFIQDRYANAAPNAGAAKKITSQPKNVGGDFSVKAPNGKTYNFKDQASLDAFKEKAGLQ